MAASAIASAPPDRHAASMFEGAGLLMRDPHTFGVRTVTQAQYVKLDPATFRDDRPQKFVHGLRDHALMQLDSFVELALRRGPAHVRVYDAKKVAAGSPLETVARDNPGKASFEDMIRRIEGNNTYLFIQNVETDPVYKPFAIELLEEVKIALRARGRKMVRGWAWVFISAPNSVTPYHRDHEQTCLFQLRGEKTLSVFRANDRDVCSDEENDFFHSNWSLKRTTFNDAFQPRAQTFDLTPGEALYMPFTAPHWVQNGSETSVSFSVTYNTEDDIALQDAHKMNALLRRAGIRPAPIGDSRVRDSLKRRAWNALQKARGLIGRPREAQARY
jgi:hypothetical protein